jgi:hypothetical protein
MREANYTREVKLVFAHIGGSLDLRDAKITGQIDMTDVPADLLRAQFGM